MGLAKQNAPLPGSHTHGLQFRDILQSHHTVVWGHVTIFNQWDERYLYGKRWPNQDSWVMGFQARDLHCYGSVKSLVTIQFMRILRVSTKQKRMLSGGGAPSLPPSLQCNRAQPWRQPRPTRCRCPRRDSWRRRAGGSKEGPHNASLQGCA